LRQELLVKAVRGALAKGKARFGLRVVHYSIQHNHIHCVVEAGDRRALSRGMRGLDIRIARAINRVLVRRGRVIGDRYHARTLRTPREVRNVLAYVLLNWRHHTRSTCDTWDLASSAVVFDGWSEGDPLTGVARQVLEEIATTRVPPEQWLLKTGWRRRGLIHPTETPGA
jgi:REP element-mobilizing transposase RayT